MFNFYMYELTYFVSKNLCKWKHSKNTFFQRFMKIDKFRFFYQQFH